MSEAIRWDSEREAWKGNYRGVGFEVTRWRSVKEPGVPLDRERYGNPEWIWNYYLLLPMAQIPERLRNDFDVPAKPLGVGRRLYYRAPDILSDLDWHGGITFYDKLGGADGMPICIKAGCDYNHLFDSEAGYPYDREWVTRDACRTIDALWEAIPDLRIRCNYNGRFVVASEGRYSNQGNFYSEQGIRDMPDAWLEKRGFLAAAEAP